MTETIKLTATAKAGGCAAKMSPSVLDAVLRRLPPPQDPNLIVGFETSDDAGVYRLRDDLALVQTVDFFTAIVDDPFTFGQIAATNALSDVYAMGGRPVSALTMVCFPANGPQDVLEQIFRGGLSKMNEAECTVLGGHSIRDEEIKFGYAVTGVIHPDEIWRNVGAQPGDILLFTKSLGTGVIATALKQDKAPSAWIDAAVDSMTHLNRAAAEALLDFQSTASRNANPIHAVTDVTGFGFLGHAREMAAGSKVSFEIDHSKLSYLTGAIEAAHGGFTSGGLRNNRDFVESCIAFAPTVAEEFRLLLYDPQTAGGLLIAVDPSHAAAARSMLSARGVRADVVGRVVPKTSPLISVI